MMEVIYCIPCAYGQHDQHIEMIEVPMPGVMGGARCPCKGECGSRKGEAMSAGEEREMPESLRGHGYWVCDRCGQAVNAGEACNSGLHVGPGEEANGMAARTTDLVPELARARARIEELEGGIGCGQFSSDPTKACVPWTTWQEAEARCASIRAETVAEIVAWLRTQDWFHSADHAMADFIEREFPAPVQADTEETSG